MASKTIVAINIDPEANMVSRADYAVIADLHEVVPAISAEIEKRRHSG
jgi:electron transfer flavoprotein alpha subunit